MKEFIEQIEKIESLGVDTRAECLMFLVEVKKLKKMLLDQVTEDGGLPIVVESSGFIDRCEMIDKINKSKDYYEKLGRYEYSQGFEKARLLLIEHNVGTKL